MSDNLIYLFAAFAVTWIVLFLYSFFLGRRQREVEREVQTLREHLQVNQDRDQGQSST